VLRPYATYLGKKLIKSLKVYPRDTGLLHALLSIENINEFMGHPVIGTSFESYVIEPLMRTLPKWSFSFYRDSSANEIDLIMQKGNILKVIDIKSKGSK